MPGRAVDDYTVLSVFSTQGEGSVRSVFRQ